MLALSPPLQSLSLLFLAAALLLLSLAGQAAALVTLRDVRALSDLLGEGRAMIVRSGGSSDASAAAGGWGQAVVGTADADEDEDTVSAALRVVDREILAVLNIPFDAGSSAKDYPPCSTVINEYHAFLRSTTLFLRAIEDKQVMHQWGGDSPVFHDLSWLQALWASRKVNEQHRSFIEQQMELYASTGCFDKSNEVLRRGVEVVEYMNDLIDSFAG